MSATELVRSVAAKLKAATSTITEEIATLRARIAQKRSELTRAREAWIPREEIDRRIHEHVEKLGAYWIGKFGLSLISGLGDPHLKGDPRLPWNHGEPLTWSLICAAEPERATAILRSLIARVAYEEGPASAQRPAIIARLERELADLEAAEEASIDAAAEAGVVVEHRPEVIERRATEARQREREAEAVRQQDAQLAAANTRHEAARSSGGRSRYLSEP